MPARVMLSSVTKDDIPLGEIYSLKSTWYEFETLAERLQSGGLSVKADSRIDFTYVRSEIQRHLEGKYGFDVYNFQNTPSDGGSPEKVTIRESHRSHLVIGIFGSKTGWKVPDQDPLTPTFREWRAALENPLKFRVFAFTGSLSARKPPALEALVKEVTDYKNGMIYVEFVDAVDLFASVDSAVRDYVNKAVTGYARDYAARQPNSETEQWLLLPYRARVAEMRRALERVAQWQGVKKGMLDLDTSIQPVELHCVPDNFSIPESRKFAAYIFDDETRDDKSDLTGTLHIVASFGGVTDLQTRRHLGSFEAAEVYSAPWGFYATVPSAGIQCVYLPRCVNSLVMQSKLSAAVSWLAEHAQQIAVLAARRNQILRLASGPAEFTRIGKAGTGRA